MPNDIAPRATTATMAPNPTPPPLAVASGNGNGAEVHMAQPTADGAPKRRTRRQAAPQSTLVQAPAVLPPAQPGVGTPLSDEELQDLGALQVLAARAGVSVEDYVEDARRLCISYDRFKAYVAARKAASVG